MIYYYLLIIIAFYYLLSNFIFVVKQQNAVVIERLGKFYKIKQAGLNFKIPIIDEITGKINLKIQQLDVVIDTKTKDNVFIRLKVSVQFKVISDRVFDAFYKLDNKNMQINSYIFDVVRAKVPKMKLDDVFEKKYDIAIEIKAELEESMKNYGYSIIKALVTDILPDEKVKNAMNRINTSEREKVAAEYEAEAKRIKIVTKAKAESEAKKLQGKGIADQRIEIAKGLLESVEILKNNVGISSQEAYSLLVMTQHYETLQYIGESNKSNLILLPNSPGIAKDMLINLISSISSANYINNVNNEKVNNEKNNTKNNLYNKKNN
ncbi:SPFH domain-containing protein [Candidatus Shikimatogenerans silvanidophilus]|uniref:SPFH domain-containing protein n=1 Tax=Candidatus Shikimatogenerans silvanidophilus TaxID=2782547 RepID=UPI001BADFBBB|nr:SPFH domain-containing protein [Candidatus Shikimatogenerans silvanidophilus]